MVQKKLPSINNAHGPETRNIINELIKLFNGMGYTYNESLSKAQNILNEAKKTNNMNKDVQRQLDNIILENGNSEAEVVQARGEENLLSKRLDKIDYEVDRTYTKSTNKTKPLISFYLDDGYQQDYTLVYPTAKSLGVPVTVCLHNTGWLISNKSALDEMISDGWEVHSHTVKDEDLRLLSYEAQYQTMKDNKRFLEDKGYIAEGLCYPRGFSNEDTLRATRELFKVGMSSDFTDPINKTPIDSYHVKRLLTDMRSLDSLKATVDETIEKGGWLVLYSHTNTFPANPSYQQKYLDIMEYVANSSAEAVTVGEALEYYENTLDIGDKVNNGEYAKIGADGIAEFTSVPYVVDKKNDDINNRLGTDFRAGFVSINKYPSTAPSNIPFNNGIGTLYTDRTFEHLGLTGTNATQEFKDSNGRVHSRQFISATGWNDWVTQGVINTARTKNYTNDSPSADFPTGKITVTEFLSSHNSGLPSTGIGTLITNKTASANTFFQIFYPYNNNSFYKRYWNSGTWSDWSLFPETIKHGETFDFGTLTAGASKTFTFNIQGTNNNMNPVVSFTSGIADGVIPFAYMAGANTVVVKLVNTRQNEATVGSRPIRFLIQ